MKFQANLSDLFRNQAAVNAIQTIGKIKFKFWNFETGQPMEGVEVDEYSFREHWVKNSGAAGGERSILALEMGLVVGNQLIVARFDDCGRLLKAEAHTGRSGTADPIADESWAKMEASIVGEELEFEWDDQYDELIDNLMGHREVKSGRAR